MKSLSLLVLITLLMACTSKQEEFRYPETRMVDSVDNYFGQRVADPYRWLEDDQSSETKAWVAAENRVTSAYLHKIPFRAKIFNRLMELWDYPKVSAPSKKGNFYLQYRNNGLQNQDVLYMMGSPEDEGEILLDPNELSEDGTVALSSTEVSDDHRYLAYLISRGGSDWQEIFVRDIKTGKDLYDHIKWVKFSGISWFKDGFFYSRYPEPKEGEALKGENRFSKIYYHKLGTPQAKDEIIYQNPEQPDWMFTCDISHDKTHLYIYVTESTTGNALYVMDLKDNSVQEIVSGFQSDYSVVYGGKGTLYAYTNANAPKYQLLKASFGQLQETVWEKVISESGKVMTGCKFMAGKFIAEYMENATSKLYLFTKTGELETQIDIPVGSVSGFTGEPTDTETFFTFTSFTTPATIYHYNLTNNDLSRFSSSRIKFDGDAYETKQIFYPSKDGTKIPMFIVHKKGLKMDGQNPTLLYGYGGFNISLTPTFSVTRLIWLENNGVIAIPNLRGGGEYGEAWHKAGTLMQKQNVFDDFIAAASYLIHEGYTAPDKLTIQGGSNGGLLIGATMNQRPDLFAVALPAVGVMDMLRYHKFTIGRFWATDYGTSEDSAEMFSYLHDYSPLHNVKKGVKYPAILITTADHDDRVVPAHSFKLAATLQANVSKENPVLIRIDTKAGHGSGKPTDMVLQEYADLWSFAFYNMQINPIY